MPLPPANNPLAVISPLAPQGPVPYLGIPNSIDAPRLVFAAPYFTTVAIADIIEPSVLEAVEGMLPTLVPPYVQDAANAAVSALAVLKTGSTMTGPLYLNGLPTQPTQAADKSYVDMMIATAGVPEVPPVPAGQLWARQTGQWSPIAPQTGVFLPLSGGSMTGNITMNGNTITGLAAVPQMPYGAAPAKWVLDQISAVSLYQGTWNADTNVPDLTNINLHVNSYTWIAITVAPGGVVVAAPIPGLQGKTVYSGDSIIYSTVEGRYDSIHAGGLTAPQADARYVMLTGSQMSGALLLNANATAPLQAVTLQQMQAGDIGAFPEAPGDGQVYGRNGQVHSWSPALPLVGGILTGSLTLAANATLALHAVPLQQLTSSLGAYVPLAGNVTMTGPLTMTGGAAFHTLNSNAVNPLHAVPLQQLTSVLGGYVPLAGNVTMTGPLTMTGGAAFHTLNSNAVNPLHAVPLQQLTAVLGGYVPLAGGVNVTGGLNIATASGNVGIGTASPGAKLDVAGDVRVSGQVQLTTSGTGSRIYDAGPNNFTCLGGAHTFYNLVGSVAYAQFDVGGTRNVSGSWLVLSDREMKEPDHTPYERGLEAITALNPIVFRYRAGTPFAEADAPSRPLMGLIADEVAPHVPEIVGETTAMIGKGDDAKEATVNTLEPGNLIFAVINSIKTLATRLDAAELKLANGGSAPRSGRSK